jgi:serine/threonine protein kinase
MYFCDILTDTLSHSHTHTLTLSVCRVALFGCRVYLHSRKLIHRDIKPQNLLVNSTWVCKVADFGISTIKPQQTQTMTCIGTPVYMAPEVLTKNKYSEKVW